MAVTADETLFALPSLGADMEVGSVIEWRVAPGDVVASGDVVAVVATEKADIDIEIWQDGTVAELLVDLDVELPVGTPILRLTGSEPVPESERPSPAPERPAERSIPPPAERTSESSAPLDARARPPIRGLEWVRASPLARRLADERGVDITAVAGSGPGGAVLAADLDPELPSTPAAPVSVASSTTRLRTAIAQQMSRANREIPHYHVLREIDLGPAMSWLREENEARPMARRLLPAALLIKATARAAAAHPELNGWWGEAGFERGEQVTVGVIVSLRTGGVMAPSLANADTLSLDETMEGLRDLVAATRSETLASRWMGRASITVTNLGDRGADTVVGVIQPPQVALIGFGRIDARPVAIDGSVVARPTVIATLSGDHRASDGLAGSRFLSTIDKQLQRPEAL